MAQNDFLAQLVAWAEQNALVRAMILTSNRADPAAAVDPLSDYDVILYVSDTAPFSGSEAWLRELGNVLLRTALEQRLEHGMTGYWRGVFYDDGTKVDFTITPAAGLPLICAKPGLPPELDLGYRVLVDKDRLTAGLKAPTCTAYIPAKPTEGAYRQLIEDFWWNATYIAKYLWRDELYAAKWVQDAETRSFVLRPMLEWLIEVENGWTVRPGPEGRRLKRYLKPEVWAAVEQTYSGADEGDIWRALFETAALYRGCAQAVGLSLGYAYPEDVHERMVSYLREIREMPGKR